MRPPVWQPPIALSPAEHAIVSRIRRAKLFIFLRRIRHELFSTAFQEELATSFRDRPKGQGSTGSTGASDAAASLYGRVG